MLLTLTLAMDALQPQQLGALIFCIVLSTYHHTLQKSVPGGDAGELIVEAWQLGLPHPPGYPTFSLLGHWFSKFEILDVPEGASPVAWKINFMSAFLNSIAGVVLFWTVLLLPAAANESVPAARTNSLKGDGQNGGDLVVRSKVYATGHSALDADWGSLAWLIGASVSAFGYCFSPLVWTYAVTAEVFALNNLFAALLLYISVMFFKAPSRQKAIAGAFLCGLGLTNQHSLVFFVLPVGFFVMLTVLRGRGPCYQGTTVLAIFTAFCVGLAPYAYMPLVTGAKGSWGDASTVEGFLKHILRKEYGTFLLHPDMVGTESWKERASLYFQSLVSKELPLRREFSVPILVTGAIHLIWYVPKKMPGFVLLFMWLTYTVVFHTLSNIDLSTPLTFAVHERFWMQPNAIAFVVFGVGVTGILLCIFYVCQSLCKSARGRGIPGARLGKSVIQFLVLCLFAAAMHTHVKLNYKIMDMSENDDLDRVFRSSLVSLPRNSLVILRGDHYTNVMRYLHQVDGVRPDLDLVSDQLVKAKWFHLQERHFPNVSFPKRRYNEYFYGFSLEEFITANAVTRPVAACSHLVTVHPQNTYTGLYYGMCDILVPSSHYPTFKPWWKKAKTLLPTKMNFTKVTQKFGPEAWEYKLYEKIFEKQQKLAADLIAYAQRSKPPNLKILKKTKKYIKSFLNQDKGPFQVQGATWKNLAVSILTVPKAMDDIGALTEGVHALREYLKTDASKVDKQLEYVKNLERQVSNALGGKKPAPS